MMRVGRLTPIVLAMLGVLAGASLFSSAPAQALNTHVFSSSFGSAGPLAGQLEDPTGLAVNNATHDIYIADTGNHRIDEFDPSKPAPEQFVRAWGWGVGGGIGFQTCTSACQTGLFGSGPGEFEAPTFIAVDNSSGESKGDVYVGDTRDNLVTKFSESGALIESWGTKGQLNGSTTGAGSFGLLGGVAVDGSGDLDVVVGGEESPNPLFEFTQTGSFVEEFDVQRLTLPRGLAVDAEGNFFKVNLATNVEEFTGPEEDEDVGQVTANEGATGLAVDSSTGDLYVDEGSHVEHYVFPGTGTVSEEGGTTCTFVPHSGCPATDTFGSAAPSGGELRGGAGLAVDPSSDRVYVADAAADKIDVFIPGVLPDVTTEPASNVGRTAATLHGTVNPDGLEVTSCEFEWGTEAGVYPHTAACTELPGSGSGPVAVSAEIGALTAATTYHFRLAATNPGGTNHGSDELFTTRDAVEGVLTSAAVEVRTISATLNGSLEPNGFDTHYWFEYGLTASYGSTTSHQDAGEASEVKSVSATATSLVPHTSYHFRLAAENSFGVDDGSDETFETLAALPAVNDRPPSVSATRTTAGLSGTVNPENSSTEYHFEYGTTVAYGSKTGGVSASSSFGDVPVGPQMIVELQPETTYHYRLVATNEAGTEPGPDYTFTTASRTLPLVSTGEASGATETGATVSGTVDSRGIETSYAFEIGTDTSYTGAKLFGDAGQGQGAEPITVALQDLAPGTTYHYRLTASNADGTSYGQDMTFTTPGIPSPIGQPLTLPLLATPLTAFPAETGTTTTTSTKALTRAQKLAAALKTCRTKSKGKRAGCERRARKQYASVKVGANKKHNKQH